MIYKKLKAETWEKVALMLGMREDCFEVQEKAARLRAEYEAFAVDLAHQIRAEVESDDDISFIIDGIAALNRSPNKMTHNSFPWQFSKVAEHPQFLPPDDESQDQIMKNNPQTF